MDAERAQPEALSPADPRARIEARAIEARGVVQGVGFRPFVWRLARRLGLDGWVRNSDGVVEIFAEGRAEDLDALCAALREEAPPLARVESVVWSGAEPTGSRVFEVAESAAAVSRSGRVVPPDVATCPACLRELFDPADRRCGYAFVNCTDCGPRFTIIEELPYDRARTSMRRFPLCEECAREYRDPADRRFHAEPVACPSCGPTLELRDAKWRPVSGDPIHAAAVLLRDGAIVAVKGLGGFHLACDATDDRAVAELRRRKARPDKPFAVMVESLARARETFVLRPEEEEMLAAWRAPIVLVRASGARRLAPSVAPGHRRHGAMLPSTPLHHLLLTATGRPLVMTSGNRSEEPICISNEEARARLSEIADAFLVHDRDIVARYDDSVTLLRAGVPAVIRRGRGHAPAPISLARAVPPVLGCGAELHASFCLASGTRAFLSQHIGDLDSEEAMGAYAAALDRYRRIFGIEPRAVAHDLHPDFLSTRFAESLGLPSFAVQHHHAHIAAVMAEHGLAGPVIGVAFDGFGLGDDHAAWGGEFLVCDLVSSARAAHLRTVRQPGGDAAARVPVRMALAHAADASELERARDILSADERLVDVVSAQIASGLGSPMTSSAGRLFDAVAALTGVCARATYEGQPAMLLEQAADTSAIGSYEIALQDDDGRVVVDTRPIVRGVIDDLIHGEQAGEIAGRFHRTMAGVVVRVCREIRARSGLSTVCLGGGVFSNDLLVSAVLEGLEAEGFVVYVSRDVPPGDGGVSLGQAVVAGARMEED